MSFISKFSFVGYAPMRPHLLDHSNIGPLTMILQRYTSSGTEQNNFCGTSMVRVKTEFKDPNQTKGIIAISPRWGWILYLEGKF